MALGELLPELVAKIAPLDDELRVMDRPPTAVTVTGLPERLSNCRVSGPYAVEVDSNPENGDDVKTNCAPGPPPAAPGAPPVLCR